MVRTCRFQTMQVKLEILNRFYFYYSRSILIFSWYRTIFCIARVNFCIYHVVNMSLLPFFSWSEC